MKKLFLITAIFLCGQVFAQTIFSSNYDRAAANLESNEFKNAITYFDKAISNKNEAASNYKVADAYIYRGYCKFRLGDLKSAHKDVNEALEIKPEYIKCYTMKVNFYFSEKKYEECIVWCDKGLALNAINEDLLISKALASTEVKKYEEAKSCLFRLLEENPRNISAFRYLGATSLKLHAWDSAVFYFSKVLEINPLDAGSFFDRGVASSYIPDYESAEKDIRKGMEIDTTLKFVGYNNLGFFLKLEQKKYKEALDYFNTAITLKPDFAYAFSNRGFSKLQLGDVKGAMVDVKHAIKLDPSNSYAFKNLGLIYLKENKPKEACKNFKKAISLGYTESYDEDVEVLLKEHGK